MILNLTKDIYPAYEFLNQEESFWVLLSRKTFICHIQMFLNIMGDIYDS